MIKITHLTFSYNGRDEALKDLSMLIKKGSWVSILGHNGSGKSTLAKLIVGLLAAQEGTIEIDGLSMSTETLSEIRQRIGIVFQNPDNQFVGVTVRHDIAFGLENQCMPQKDMKQTVLDYATLVGMEGYLDKEPHQLSGGQKQRVAIASALAMNQDILILDEATSMLDPEGTRDIVSLIKRLNKTLSKTVVTITHDLSFAALSDHLIVLKEGQVLLEGAPSEVFKQEAVLLESNLELPFELKLYNAVKNDPSINDEIAEALWAFNSNM
jgi:energy-coupling factor transport system ATP-binding protein